ncbi:NADH-quinone oxidoreductase subunit C [Trinickia caryophylli]|uniref:Ni,Fe-hydrogenase III large subunit n=1 Tax=Trinickia caryophylli TaxID=28094 RepID=A0A1X7DCF3_TRICW|nr:NADH-quinone oxidoreductase subunit C [Trinickia caryophylli]PMS09751.1 Ni,Fe-hydrogenase III large subunit [Trinickia caryophylli]TRX16812.1 Ni,Fe-hydrogenase III large subunit [Trinickia caryophylli]WQE12462.1 NADH-quinone oxidoreductase subunit C [Trinickia caryophylli]SMF12918.1 Ni,Fe-hydrogenase III large subunit [Trinickia caryophylli]GLU31388.1 formate hydrogenlyase/hydrogenase/NADH dehydrogenase subunit [Trinickia caryophylli]
MRIDALGLSGLVPLSAPAGRASVFLADTDAATWVRVASAAFEHGNRLISLWGTETASGTFVMSAAYAMEDGLLWVRIPAATGDDGAAGYPDLSRIFACASRMQRAVYDLLGLRATGAADTRPWLNHGNWPADYFPLRSQSSGNERFECEEADYPFVQVAGDGVHEIAVGPIHAGIIEPGHFRFSVVGEKILRLEERLGYAHRGIERLFVHTPLLLGHRVAGRIAGDTTVAFSWAYCMAVERALKVLVPPRAQWLRALMLERERVANHLGDLGALGNDAGFAFGLAQFSRMKEDWLRLNDRMFGHRYLMDQIVPGGVRRDIAADVIESVARQCERTEEAVRTMQRIFEEQSGLQDRFTGAGKLSALVARHFSVCGLAARASGLGIDVRVDHPYAPYLEVQPRIACDNRGDVAARVAVRFNEVYESLRLIRAFLDGLPDGDVVEPVESMEAGQPPSYGVGWIEGWRGDVLVAIETGENGTIARCHCHDPSWHNWPALEHAIIGNIVPDFPLINKSFNLNYAGHDL